MYPYQPQPQVIYVPYPPQSPGFPITGMPQGVPSSPLEMDKATIKMLRRSKKFIDSILEESKKKDDEKKKKDGDKKGLSPVMKTIILTAATPFIVMSYAGAVYGAWTLLSKAF